MFPQVEPATQRIFRQPGTTAEVNVTDGSPFPGVRVDTWVESGTEVTPFYDSLLGKLMVHGVDRPDAVAKMVKALKGTVLAGIPSNLEYLGAIFASEGFHAGLCTHMHEAP